MNKKTEITNKKKPKNDAEDKRKYFQMMDRKTIQIRVNPAERSLLEIEKKKIGSKNTSGFIKYKLFGIHPEVKLETIIESNDEQSIGIIIQNYLFNLVNYYSYITYRYERDMRQLYREEGVDVEKWIEKTNLPHEALLRRTDETFRMINKIAKAIGLNDFMEMPSDAMKIDVDNASKEELDRLAEQIQKENALAGRPDTFR